MIKKIFIIILFLTAVLVENTNAQTAKEVVIKNFEQILDGLSEYDYGEPQIWKPQLIDAMKPVYSNPEISREVEKRMLAFLKSDASPEAKKALQQGFSMVVTKESENEILNWLQNKEIANLALAILDHSGLGAVSQFEKIIPDVPKSEKIGIINLLGNRRDEGAVDFLAGHAENEDEDIAVAAVWALAKTGTVKSGELLQEISEIFPAKLNRELLDAKLLCANRLLENGNKMQAQGFFLELNKEGLPLPVRTAALNGLLKNSSKKTQFIKEQLKRSGNPELRREIIRLVIHLPKSFQNGQEFFESVDLSLQEKVQLMAILGDRKDLSIHGVAAGYLSHGEEILRHAALRIIPAVGSDSDVAKLAKVAAEKSGTEKQLAQNALFTLPGKDVNNKIIELLADVSSEEKIQLIQAAGERNMTEASEVLFELAESENPAIKMEAIGVLGKVAGYSDLEKMITILLNSSSARERNNLEDAVLLLAARNSSQDESSGVFTVKLKNENDGKNISSILSILGKLGNDDDYKVIGKFFKYPEEEVQNAAIRAVADWPTQQPLNDLQKLLADNSNRRQHALAMKSYLQIIDINEKMSSGEKIEKLKTAYELSSNLIERRMIVSSFSKINEAKCLSELAALMSNEEIRREVEMAILEIAPKIWEQDELVIERLEKIIQASSNEKFIEQVNKEIKNRKDK